MFVPFWLIFLVSGTLLAVLTIVWAIGSRQFDDQDRARYLPLAGLAPGRFTVEHNGQHYGTIELVRGGPRACVSGSPSRSP